MRKGLLVMAGLMAALTSAVAQKWEVGMFGGISHYNGEFSEGLIMLDQVHPAAGLVVRYNLNKNWAIRGGFYQGTISGTDKNASDLRRRQRNLHFFSPVTEISILPEYNFSGYKIRSKNMKFSPFAYTGLAVYKFNPQAEYKDGRIVALQPLRTEGQGSLYYASIGDDRQLYALTQISVPFGIGLKYAIGWNINLSFEISARKVFTDYLDDVSKTYSPQSVFDQTGTGDIGYAMSDRRRELNNVDIAVEDLYGARGNSTTQDWYYFHGFTLTYSIFPPQCFKF